MAGVLGMAAVLMSLFYQEAHEKMKPACAATVL